jgi:hypothetical protein
MIGEIIEEIRYTNDNIIIVTNEGTYDYSVIGEWGHEAWVESVDGIENVIGQEVVETRFNDWHCLIRTHNGDCSIELRCEYGYYAWLS